MFSLSVLLRPRLNKSNKALLSVLDHPVSIQYLPVCEVKISSDSYDLALINNESLKSR